MLPDVVSTATKDFQTGNVLTSVFLFNIIKIIFMSVIYWLYVVLLYTICCIIKNLSTIIYCFVEL